MRVTLSDAERRFLALFEDETGASAHDCVVLQNGADGEDGDGSEERVVIVVAAGEMGQAIGSNGKNVAKVERKLGRTVELVEDADTAEDFVANALAPAAVNHVTVSDQDSRVAYVEVVEDDRGVAIGRGGRNIETARVLASRHYDVDDIQLT